MEEAAWRKKFLTEEATYVNNILHLKNMLYFTRLNLWKFRE